MSGTPNFLQDYWSRRPVLDTGPENRYASLFDEGAVDDLITSRGLRLPAFRMVRDGQLLDPCGYTKSASLGHGQVHDLIDPNNVIQLFLQGATLILRGLHRYHAGISEFCNTFALDLGHPVQANVYATPPSAQGFRVHYDNHDVFVLQCFGTKEWVVYEPVRMYPLKGDEEDQYVRPDELGHEVIHELLRSGDTLYIPRGWPHRAVTDTTTSIHLTIGVHVFTWLDVLGLLLDKARACSALRATIPTPVDNDAFRDGLRAASAAFSGLLDRADIAELSESMTRRIRARQGPLAPGSWASIARASGQGERGRHGDLLERNPR
jgi:hypothetical protein